MKRFLSVFTYEMRGRCLCIIPTTFVGYLELAVMFSDSTGWPKMLAANFCSYLRQILTDFQNFFTEPFCGKICNKSAYYNFPRKTVNIWRRYGQKIAAYYFGPP